MLTPTLSRRAAFAALTVPAATALTSTARAAPLPDGALRDVCFLTPQSIEGPSGCIQTRPSTKNTKNLYNLTFHFFLYYYSFFCFFLFS